MSLWLMLIILGVVLAVIGFGGAGQMLIWIGLIILVAGLVMSLMRRGSTSL
jgi:membrane protein implicated in regulation of membrane protease activity